METIARNVVPDETSLHIVMYTPRHNKLAGGFRKRTPAAAAVVQRVCQCDQIRISQKTARNGGVNGKKKVSSVADAMRSCALSTKFVRISLECDLWRAYVCMYACVMWEPYTLSLERSREHGAAVNCADRRNIAVVKVLSPAERVSSPPPRQGRWSGCCRSGKIPYPLPRTTLNPPSHR